MSDVTTAKPTISSLATELAELRKLVFDSQESASTGLQVSQANGDKIKDLNDERIALARAVSMMSERLNKVAETAGGERHAVDGILARIEAVEQRTSGETGDWAPVIQALDSRLRELAELVGEGDTGVGDVGRETDLHDRIDGLATAQKDAHEKLLTRVQYIEKVINERTINDALTDTAQFGPVMPRDGVPHQLAFPNTASVKVLDLMRMVDVIGKERDYSGGGTSFKFRGVDQAMDATGHAMRQVGLTLQTEVLGRETTHNTVVKYSNGKPYDQLWTTTILTMRYVFVDPMTGHAHPFEMIGEGRDVADKSASKAAAMACKYALFQALMIPVAGLNDTDSDSERPVVENVPRDTPGRQVSQGRMTPAQAVQEYAQRGYQGDAAGPEDPAIGRPDNAYHTVPGTDDDLAQRAAFAARHLMEVQREPAHTALPKIQAAKTRIEELGIGGYVVSLAADGSDRAPLSVMVSAALQSVNAAVNRSVGAQGVTRQGQQTGEGARALASQPQDYEGTEQEYLDSLKVLGSSAPDDVQAAAERVVMRWESKHNG